MQVPGAGLSREHLAWEGSECPWMEVAGGQHPGLPARCLCQERSSAVPGVGWCQKIMEGLDLLSRSKGMRSFRYYSKKTCGVCWLPVLKGNFPFRRREKIVKLQPARKWELPPEPFDRGGRRKKMLSVDLCHIITKKQTGKGAEGQDPL